MCGYEGIHDSRPRHDETTNTVPTRRCTTAISRRCCRGGSQYTIYDPATRTGPVRRPLHADAVPEQHRSLQGAVRPGGRRDPLVLSDHREEPGDAVGLDNYADAARRKGEVLQPHLRVDQNIGDRQRFFVRYSTTSATAPTTTTSTTRLWAPVLVLFEGGGIRPRLHALADDDSEHPLQLQPVHPRLGRPALGVGFDLPSWASPRSMPARFRKTSRASRAST